MVQHERVLRDITANTALVITMLGCALLLVAVLAEVLRRRPGHSRFVRIADRLLPTAARRTAVAVLAVLSAVTTGIGPQAASADTSVRNWLTDPTTTTSQPGPESAPITLPPFRNDSPPAIEPSTPTTTMPTTRNTPSASTPSVATPTVITPPVSTPPVNAAPPAPRTAPVVRAPKAGDPDRAVSAAPPAASAASNPVPTAQPPATELAAASAMYQVVPGDCLWSIASRVLGGHASSSTIDRGWRAIYAANRAAIGDDPNLIHPGLMLSLPSLTATP